MNQFFNALNNNPILNVMRYAQQVKQDPSKLAALLQQRGIINEQQVKDIQQMGSNYAQVGEYLIQNGKMPNNVQQYENQVNQVQNMMGK